jgi:hypothetical protein
MTQNIFNIVHAMADNKKMPTGFKITSRDGTTLHDSKDVNFAGVDDAINNDEEYENNNHKVEDNNNNTDNTDEINPNDIGDIIKPTRTENVTYQNVQQRK